MWSNVRSCLQKLCFTSPKKIPCPQNCGWLRVWNSHSKKTRYNTRKTDVDNGLPGHPAKRLSGTIATKTTVVGGVKRSCNAEVWHYDRQSLAHETVTCCQISVNKTDVLHVPQRWWNLCRHVQQAAVTATTRRRYSPHGLFLRSKCLPPPAVLRTSFVQAQYEICRFSLVRVRGISALWRMSNVIVIKHK